MSFPICLSHLLCRESVTPVTCSYCYLPVYDANLWVDSEIISRPISAGLLLITRRPEEHSRTYHQLHKYASENCEQKGDRKGVNSLLPGMKTFCLLSFLAHKLFKIAMIKKCTQNFK